MRSEVEDGMGFPGLVSSPREREEETYRETARKIAAAREKRLMESLQHVARLRGTLVAAQAKLQFYREQHSGEYVGGVEFHSLMQQIDEVLKETA